MHASEWGRNKLILQFQYTRGDKGRSNQRKKNYFGKPYTQGVKERPREVESYRLKSCIIKSIISVTICERVLRFVSYSYR